MVNDAKNSKNTEQTTEQTLEQRVESKTVISEQGLMDTLESYEKELKELVGDSYLDARGKQQYKNLIDKIENRKALPNMTYKGVSILDILKESVKEDAVSEENKKRVVYLTKKITAIKEIMG